MNLSPENIDTLLELTADRLAEKIVGELGSLSDIIVVDLRMAAHMLALSTKQVPVYLPLTRTAEGKHGVTIGAIRRHVESRTEQPKGIARRKGAAA
jgi:hypothetical protein